VDLSPCLARDIADLTTFLATADLTISGIEEPGVRIWVERDASGEIVGSTGYELSGDGDHALIRSVAVASPVRARGRGNALARFALARAAEGGATRAWLFSRRSGPFWQQLGFEPANRYELAEALANTHQVRLFQQTGQLHNERAWSRAITPQG